MKTSICGIVFLTVFLWTYIPNGSAFYERYPPFDLKAWEDRTLKASPINKPEEKGKFQDGDIAISWITNIPKSSVIEIRYKHELIEKTELPGNREWADFLENIYYIDLDRNGLSDIVLISVSLGSGLGAFYKTTFIYLQIAPGKFKRLEFTSLYFEITDFVSFVGAEKPVLLMMQLAQIECSDKKIHSFWVYVPYKIKDFNLLMDRNLHPDFPKFIWFSEKQNSQPTDKLSQTEKEQYLGTLPTLIKSVPVSS